MKAWAVGILGGPVDPVHLGPVAAALAARRALGLDDVLLIPSHHPPHRAAEPRVSAYHRFAMVALAASAHEGLLACDVELVAPGPSYTSSTLRRLHDRGLEPRQLFFITGADAFAEIETWNQYPAILDLGHFVVVSRPGHPLEALRDRLPAVAGRMRAVGPSDGERARAAENPSMTVFLLEAQTPDISSTEIRARVAAGQDIDALVPPAVGRYIARHGLYARERGC